MLILLFFIFNWHFDTLASHWPRWSWSSRFRERCRFERHRCGLPPGGSSKETRFEWEPFWSVEVTCTETNWQFTGHGCVQVQVPVLVNRWRVFSARQLSVWLKTGGLGFRVTTKERVLGLIPILVCRFSVTLGVFLVCTGFNSGNQRPGHSCHKSWAHFSGPPGIPHSQRTRSTPPEIHNGMLPWEGSAHGNTIKYWNIAKEQK